MVVERVSLKPQAVNLYSDTGLRRVLCMFYVSPWTEKHLQKAASNCRGENEAEKFERAISLTLRKAITMLTVKEQEQLKRHGAIITKTMPDDTANNRKFTFVLQAIRPRKLQVIKLYVLKDS